MSELKELLKENFKRNWKRSKFRRIAISSLMGIAVILAFILFVYVIGNYPWILIAMILLAAAAIIAFGFYKAIDEQVRG